MIKKIINYFFSFHSYGDKIYSLYRKSHKFCKSDSKYNRCMIDYYNYKMYKKYNCTISGYANIDSKLTLPHPMSIVIGGVYGKKTTKIGNNVTIYQNVTIGQKEAKYPIIGNNVIIYAGAKIIGDVHIGNNVIIGANAVVIRDVPDNCVVAGVPAKVIKKN